MSRRLTSRLLHGNGLPAESVFRSLELGLRPIRRHEPRWAEGHPFFTVIAGQPARVIRTRPRHDGEHAGLEHAAPHRVTATFRRPDGRPCTSHGHPTRPAQPAIHDAPCVDSRPGGVRKTIV